MEHLGATAAQASDYRNDPMLTEQEGKALSNKVWVSYIFETFGGIAGGILAAYALKGKGCFWGSLLAGLAGGVGGSLAGAELGDYLYENNPQVFDPLFELIYANSAVLQEQGYTAGEAFIKAVIEELGFDSEIATGSDEVDWLVAYKWAERNGMGGDDYLLGWHPELLRRGEKINSDNPNSELAETDRFAILDGGEGDDWLVIVGGENAWTIGGEGRDWIFNTSANGVIFGDTIDGLVQGVGDPLTWSEYDQLETPENFDNIWWWGGTTMWDPRKGDVLKFFGYLFHPG